MFTGLDQCMAELRDFVEVGKLAICEERFEEHLCGFGILVASFCQNLT